ncbi:hypothetical protein BRD00_12455 [Halobacteriales archaeon QS_8_69_26]|nr:MAG: hypothetical protein BRD00_12455 [Halobacteriales archaeon QS_8_69_26]
MRSPLTVRRCGFLGVLAGVAFVPYALTKGSLATTVKERGWSTPVTTAADTALTIHLFETVFVVLLLVGLLCYATDRRRSIGRMGNLGLGMAAVGFLLAIVTHYGEHVLDGPAVTGLPGEGDVFTYGYLVSWVVVESGQSLLGVDVVRTDGRSIPGAVALAGTLPVVLVVGFAAIATGAYTLAGVHRLTQGVLHVVIGLAVVGTGRGTGLGQVQSDHN